MQDLNRRNTETVEQVLKDQNSKINEQQIRIDLLNTAIASLTQKVTELERMVMLQKIASIGSGPSIKPTT